MGKPSNGKQKQRSYSDASEAETEDTSRLQETEDFKWLMSHPAGRRIVWRLLEKAGVFRTSFTGNSETFFREGVRSMGLFVLDEVFALTPDAFTLMLKEHNENE